MSVHNMLFTPNTQCKKTAHKILQDASREELQDILVRATPYLQSLNSPDVVLKILDLLYDFHPEVYSVEIGKILGNWAIKGD